MKKIIKNKTQQRKTRTRKAIETVSDRPRLSVSRSNQYCYAQIVLPSGQTVVGVSEKTLRPSSGQAGKEKVNPMDSAKKVGVAIAKLALEKKITTVVFDKGRLSYHGRVKALAEGAREGGLQF